MRFNGHQSPESDFLTAEYRRKDFIDRIGPDYDEGRVTTCPDVVV